MPLSQPALLPEEWRLGEDARAGPQAWVPGWPGASVLTFTCCLPVRQGKLVNLSVTVVAFSVKWWHSNIRLPVSLVGLCGLM